MAAGEQCEKVRKQTAQQGQKQTGQKVWIARKSYKSVENKRKQAKQFENEPGAFCCSLFVHFPVAIWRWPCRFSPKFDFLLRAWKREVTREEKSGAAEVALYLKIEERERERRGVWFPRRRRGGCTGAGRCLWGGGQQGFSLVGGGRNSHQALPSRSTP